MIRDFIIRGGVVMYPLLLCSLAALAAIVERVLFFLRLRRDAEGQDERATAFRRLMQAGDRQKALMLLKDGNGPVDRVLLAGVKTADEHEVVRSLRAAAAAERKRLFAGLSILDTVVTAAPLLGLLGTVLGILHTFNVIGGGPVVRSMETVGKGIAEALITTATGLVIAVPALVALNYFVRRAEEANETLEREIACFEREVQRHGSLLEAQSQD